MREGRAPLGGLGASAKAGRSLSQASHLSLFFPTFRPPQKDAWTPMKRNDMEADLTFQGLIIFRNELRPDSAETIAALKVSEERKGERLGA